MVSKGTSGDRADQLRLIVEGHDLRRTDVAIQWRKESQKRQKEHPDNYLRIRNKSLKERYGITLAQYDEMLIRQGGKCAICESLPKNGPLYVDHCHTKGHVRGLLCAKCNSMMAVIDAGHDVMCRLMEYAEKYGDA